MRGRQSRWLHLDEINLVATLRKLPSSLATSQATANHRDFGNKRVKHGAQYRGIGNQYVVRPCT